VGVFERFTERARQVVVLAQDEARALKHNYIGTEHLLLGLLREEGGLAAKVLDSLGVALADARAQVKRIVGEGEMRPSGQVPFTPRAKKVLELALREAQSLGHHDIGTEHILLGLIREGEGVGAQILVYFRAQPERVRASLNAVFDANLAPADLLDGEPRLRVPRSASTDRKMLVVGWVLFALALGIGILIGWAIWGA
jgi:ATP-dependent Clp protease ATP-binding subunit ClpA